MSEITSFKGRHRFLSNFWPAKVCLNGVFYPTVEHAYQAAKFQNPSTRNRIRVASSPGQAKRIARKMPGLCDDWEQVKIAVMKGLLLEKFSEGSLRRQLLATKDAELIEGNAWGDTFWGVCNGRGQNHLGRLLMEVRSELESRTGV